MARDHEHLSRRERQIMDTLYELDKATAAEVRQSMPDPPSYSTVRALLSKLEAKGHIRHEEQGPRYVFSPVVPRSVARETALGRLVKVFFAGSPADAVTGLLGQSAEQLSDRELEALAEQIEAARKARSES